MLYRVAADVMSAIHLTLMVFLIFGQLAIIVGIVFRWRWIRNPWFRWIHMAIILIVAVEALIDVNCPLTDWEHDLRRLGGAWGEEMTFTARVVRWLLFPDVSDSVLFGCYIGFALMVLLTFLLAPPWIRAPRGQMVLKLGCAAGANGTPTPGRPEGRKGYAELAIDRPREAICRQTIVCPSCERSVEIEVRSRRRFARAAVVLALLGLGIACVGFFWAYPALPTRSSSWYELTATSFTALREDGVTSAVLQKLEPLKAKQFWSRDDFERELGKILNQDERRRFEETVRYQAISSLRYKSWQNTIIIVGLVLFVLAPSGLLIRKGLVAPSSAAAPAPGRHRLFA
ncbi:MAG TPA: DUF2784 domain-containing protein [Gemmataceae bacterium]|nr:DUF2784 domain-containing protein [Gemmataceae bacterium]